MAVVNFVRMSGLPPQVRGAPTVVVAAALIMGLTPAGAGSTSGGVR